MRWAGSFRAGSRARSLRQPRALGGCRNGLATLLHVQGLFRTLPEAYFLFPRERLNCSDLFRELSMPSTTRECGIRGSHGRAYRRPWAEVEPCLWARGSASAAAGIGPCPEAPSGPRVPSPPGHPPRPGRATRPEPAGRYVPGPGWLTRPEPAGSSAPPRPGRSPEPAGPYVPPGRATGPEPARTSRPGQATRPAHPGPGPQAGRPQSMICVRGR